MAGSWHEISYPKLQRHLDAATAARRARAALLDACFVLAEFTSI